MRRWFIMLLAFSMLAGAAGCARTQEEEPEGYVLYFTVSGEQEYGPALGTQPYVWGDEPASVDTLLEALLAGPTREELSTPFPRGVSVLNWELDEESGTLSITMSEQYSGLGDISLTLADYCIVLTLCQLDGVEGVEIHSAGYSNNYRSHQLLRPGEVELRPPERDGT